MSGRLTGKVALVTGGASGIGRSVTELFVREGAKVVIGDLNGELLEAAVAVIGAEHCVGIRVDVTSEPDIEALVATAVSRFGQLDLAVNSAGIGTLSPIQSHPKDSWQSVIDVCLTGVFLSVKHESQQMLSQATGGRIVNIGSLNGRQAAEGLVAYCSAKAGVEMLTRVTALELGPHNIRVNAIAPGYVETPMTAGSRDSVKASFIDSIPVGRAGQPDDIARAALFLVSDDSDWINGETLVVDGGESSREYPRMLTRP